MTENFSAGPSFYTHAVMMFSDVNVELKNYPIFFVEFKLMIDAFKNTF